MKEVEGILKEKMNPKPAEEETAKKKTEKKEEKKEEAQG